MPTKRRIVIADLDDASRSIVQECLPSDHFQRVEFRENEQLGATGQVDLVIFRAAKEMKRTMEICATLRSKVGLGAPLMACVGMYANAVIRPLLLKLTLPITFLTLGLSIFLVNALMLMLAASFVDGFEVKGFRAALWGSLGLGVMNFLVGMMLS